MEFSSTPVKEKKGLKRLWNKIKSIFRSKSKDKKRKTQIVTTQPPRQETPPPESIVAPEVVPTATPDISRTIAQAPSESIAEMSATSAMQVDPERKPDAPQVDSIQQERGESNNQPSYQTIPPDPAKEELARRYERAQAIFTKYNIDLSEAGWDARPKSHIERVHKQTRIRVRWTCHECNTTFGLERICVECAHPRCKACVRYPAKRKKARDAKKASLTTATTEPATNRVHDGACHECQTTFKIGSEECSNCHHIICHRCLQESLASAEQGEERTTVII